MQIFSSQPMEKEPKTLKTIPRAICESFAAASPPVKAVSTTAQAISWYLIERALKVAMTGAEQNHPATTPAVRVHYT